jgi:hypothetical protein
VNSHLRTHAYERTHPKLHPRQHTGKVHYVARHLSTVFPLSSGPCVLLPRGIGTKLQLLLFIIATFILHVLPKHESLDTNAPCTMSKPDVEQVERKRSETNQLRSLGAHTFTQMDCQQKQKVFTRIHTDVLPPTKSGGHFNREDMQSTVLDHTFPVRIAGAACTHAECLTCRWPAPACKLGLLAHAVQEIGRAHV